MPTQQFVADNGQPTPMWQYQTGEGFLLLTSTGGAGAADGSRILVRTDQIVMIVETTKNDVPGSTLTIGNGQMIHVRQPLDEIVKVLRK